MKKFLVCLFVAVLVISAGFAIFFFVGNQEKITLSASTLSFFPVEKHNRLPAES